MQHPPTRSRPPRRRLPPLVTLARRAAGALGTLALGGRTAAAARPLCEGGVAGRACGPAALAQLDPPRRAALWERLRADGMSARALRVVWDDQWDALRPATRYPHGLMTRRQQARLQATLAALDGPAAGAGVSLQATAPTPPACRPVDNAAAVEGYSVYTPSNPAALQRNKAALLAAAQAASATAPEQRELVALAMLETENMEVSERDPCKDGTDAQNISALNMSDDLLRHLGASPGAIEALAHDTDDATSLATAATYALAGIRQMGLDAYVTRLREGYGSGGDPAQLPPFREALAATCDALADTPALLTDGRRFGTKVAHIAR